MRRTHFAPGLLLSFLLLLLFSTLQSAGAATCAPSARRCAADADCCGGLVCGPGSTCQVACRIDSVFWRSGLRNPLNPCQSCQPSRSTIAWSNLNSGSCNDANACTSRDTCSAGVCVGGPPISCADTNRCNTDGCDPARGCVHAPVHCDDANPCTEDFCNPSNGQCTFRSSTTACNDGNPCTADACDPASGCIYSPKAGRCDDGNPCTTTDVCDAGLCAGGPPRNCDDHDPWTADACDPRRGCVHDGQILEPSVPAAFLVFPKVVASNVGSRIETMVTISNVGSVAILAHVSFLNGDVRDPRYCYECDFDVPLQGRESQTLLFTRSGSLTRIRNQTTGATRQCAHAMGFLTVDVEDAAHRVLTSNVLTGAEVILDYGTGAAFPLPALSYLGGSGNGNRSFAFDGVEYERLPSLLETDFLAPDPSGRPDARLVLFTLAFARQLPPGTDCSIVATDAYGGQYSNSLQFGCWTSLRLQDIDPQLSRSNLPGGRGHLQLVCTVRGTGGNSIVHGGVEGVLFERDSYGRSRATILETSGSGDPLSLRLGDPVSGSGPWR